MKLEFDENAFFIKATPLVDMKRMRSAIGCLKGMPPGGSVAWIGQDTKTGRVAAPPREVPSRPGASSCVTL